MKDFELVLLRYRAVVIGTMAAKRYGRCRFKEIMRPPVIGPIAKPRLFAALITI
jgi:hypothetical protein